MKETKAGNPQKHDPMEDEITADIDYLEVASKAADDGDYESAAHLLTIYNDSRAGAGKLDDQRRRLGASSKRLGRYAERC